MKYCDTFGKRLRCLRQERGVKVSELARRLNKWPEQICQWESGVCIPYFDTVIMIACALWWPLGAFDWTEDCPACCRGPQNFPEHMRTHGRGR